MRGGGRKPYAQKGSGNARQGSKRTPLRPGGGVVFGPKVLLLFQETGAELSPPQCSIVKGCAKAARAAQRLQVARNVLTH